uniref:Ig-like domain-containing protein n=1 Tax=Heliothis virescens TaxID=7102 RepID=A0A2A4JUC8_HELVI
MYNQHILRRVEEINNKSREIYGTVQKDFDTNDYKINSHMYPKGDKRKLSELSHAWRKYYTCSAHLLGTTTKIRVLPNVLLMVFQGSVARLPCNLCAPPGSLPNIKWMFTRHPRKPFGEVETGDRLTIERDTMTIYNVMPSDEGVFWCMLGTGGGGLVLLEITDTEPYTVVKPRTSRGPHAVHKEMYQGVILSTKWSRWSECSVCGKVGRRHRYGMCYVNLDLNLIANFEDDPVTTAAYTTVIELDQKLIELFQAFPTGLPCRSQYLPKTLQAMKALQQRPSEIMIGMCKVPCLVTPTVKIIHPKKSSTKKEPTIKSSNKIEQSRKTSTKTWHTKKLTTKKEHTKMSSKMEHSKFSSPKIEHTKQSSTKIEHTKKTSSETEQTRYSTTKIDHTKPSSLKIGHTKQSSSEIEHTTHSSSETEQSTYSSTKIEHTKQSTSKLEHSKYSSTKIEHSKYSSTKIEHSKQSTSKIEHSKYSSTKIGHTRKLKTKKKHTKKTSVKIIHSTQPSTKIGHTRKLDTKKGHTQTVSFRIEHWTPTITKIEYFKKSSTKIADTKSNTKIADTKSSTKISDTKSSTKISDTKKSSSKISDTNKSSTKIADTKSNTEVPDTKKSSTKISDTKKSSSKKQHTKRPNTQKVRTKKPKRPYTIYIIFNKRSTPTEHPNTPSIESKLTQKAETESARELSSKIKRSTTPGTKEDTETPSTLIKQRNKRYTKNETLNMLQYSLDQSETLFFSLKDMRPQQPPMPVRNTIYAVFQQRIALRCPGTTLRDVPILWKRGTKVLIPRDIDIGSGHRVYINCRDHLVFTTVYYRDEDLYSCWQRGNLAGSVQLVVWAGPEAHWRRPALLGAALALALLLLRLNRRASRNVQRGPLAIPHQLQ